MNKLYIGLYLCTILYADIIKINLITTNDIHGVISSQKANFMNPQYPPTILGGAAFSKYVDTIKLETEKNIEDEYDTELETWDICEIEEMCPNTNNDEIKEEINDENNEENDENNENDESNNEPTTEL